MPKSKQNGHLRLDPRNARRHSETNKKRIRQSLDLVGAGRSILADANGIVRAGNGVFEAWTERGGKVKLVETTGDTLVVVQRKDLKGKDAVRAAMLDNLAADTSAYDYDAEILAEIARDDEIVAAIAREDAKLAAALKGEAKAELVDVGELVDRAAQLQEKWQVKRGDIWQIGKHKLMCGDSTSAEDVVALMGGEKWDLIVTSPPYNSGDGGYKTDYHGKTKKFYVAKVDNRTEAEYVTFCNQVLNAAANVRREDTSVIVWNVAPTVRARKGYGLSLFGGAHPFTVKETIAWDKGRGFPSASRGILSRRCEFVFVLSVGETYNTTQGENEPRWNLWEIGRPEKQDNAHRATFPVELPMRAINDFSGVGAVVYDPFCGLASTLVACEQAGRVGLGMELEPCYVSASLERLTALGLTAQRVNG